MIPKKGDIVRYTYNTEMFHRHGGRTVVLKMIEVGGNRFHFEVLSKNGELYGDLKVGDKDYWNGHMFNDSKYGEWRVNNEYNVLDLLKRVDEIGQGTT